MGMSINKKLFRSTSTLGFDGCEERGFALAIINAIDKQYSLAFLWGCSIFTRSGRRGLSTVLCVSTRRVHVSTFSLIKDHQFKTRMDGRSRRYVRTHAQRIKQADICSPIIHTKTGVAPLNNIKKRKKNRDACPPNLMSS